jgi:hypothetical protein
MRYGIMWTRRFRLLHDRVLTALRSRGADTDPFDAWFRQLEQDVSTVPPLDAVARRVG